MIFVYISEKSVYIINHIKDAINFHVNDKTRKRRRKKMANSIL